jgi:hypothetical protein
MAAVLPLLLALAGAPPSVALDLAHTPFEVSGAIRSFAASGSQGGTMQVHLRGSGHNAPDKWGELLFDLRGTSLAGRRWNDRARLAGALRVSASLVGEGKRNWHRAHRARFFLEDARRRRLYLPHRAIVDRPRATDGWLPLAGLVTVDVPMPLGFTDEGFDPARVTGLGVNVEAFNREGETVAGSIEVRDVGVTFSSPVPVRLLPVDPAVRAGEAARAARMLARLRDRCGLGPTGMAVGVNLAWPSVRTPDGQDMQLYGRLLDAGTEQWWGRLWDLGDEEVARSVRGDFREIRQTFGPGAVVRLWLFADGRTGLVLGGPGEVTVTGRARANMAVLLALAAAERVVLIPVLLDFGLADGIARSGPDGAWPVAEHLELVTDPGRRASLVAALESFLRPFADHPAVLAWDVMNEPGNAAAAATPEHFADLQALMRDLVDAVHRAGGMATVGHRNVPEARRFWRGRVASDLGQVHYYPFVETRPNPTPFGAPLAPAFGPLPAGWGELQALPGRIAEQLATAAHAGHRLFLFWSWRGHEDNGDGFAVKPHAEEIRRSLAALRDGRVPPAAAPRR